MPNRMIRAMIGGLILLTATAHAALVVGTPGDPGVGNCVPFGCSDAAEYQQIYDSSLFPSPLTIAGLTFFLRNFDNTNPITLQPIVPNNIYPANYTITLAVVALPVDTLDTDLANNLLNPVITQTFFVGFLSDFVNDHFTIQTTPQNYFNYDPSQGNLLIDIQNDGTDPSVTMYADVNSSSAGTFSSAYDSNPHPFGCLDGTAGTTTGCATADFGLVTEFDTPADFDTTSAPEPAALLFAASGLIALSIKRTLKRLNSL